MENQTQSDVKQEGLPKGLEGLALPESRGSDAGLPAVTDLVKEPAHVPPSMDGMSASSFSTLTHGYLFAAVTFAEQKAAFVFAAVSAFLGYLTSTGLIKKLIVSAPYSWGLLEYLGLVAVGGLAASIIFIFWTVIPRLGGDSKGIVYFNAIAGRSQASSYVGDVLEMSDFDRTRQLLQHCYELSFVCRRKYRSIRLAMFSGAIGLVAGLVYVSLA